MIRGFYTARTGLMSHQTNMDTIANNLANVNTVGYKPLKVSFTDLMYQNINREAENPAMVGHGVKVNKTDLRLEQGALNPTYRDLDFAIERADGFFAVQTASGDIQYTRAGNFIMSGDSDDFYLAAPNGDRILDEDGSEIELEYGDDGNLIIDPSQIGVFIFPNPHGLVPVGGNRFVETDVSGEAEALETPKLRVGYLENSAVEVADEMAKVIEASKAFSFSSRMIQVADEVEQTINQLR